ncbi:MAG: flagellar hook-basal body complex protein [Planctomycetota bacterium]|jgi:flagellar hook protein FlgE|nr:flagellar hook-basal body complex protein [Planctomycetota bacterium]
MGLSKALYTGWTGLATHQRALDNTGNNLANTNTAGFKSSDFLFANLFNQILTGSVPGDGIRGATAGIHMGAGVTTGAINPNWRSGPIESTGRNLDVAINGQGFFLLNTPYGQALTRTGSFYLDHTIDPNQRMLCQGDGLAVQGWMARGGGVTPDATTENIYLPAISDHLPGKETTTVRLGGVLPTDVSGTDFAGRETRNITLAGNLTETENSLRTSIYAPVTRMENGEAVASNEIREIPVEIVFSDPTVSRDGLATEWTWTTRTVDWPRPGDPPVQIHPASDGSSVAGTVSFWNADDPARTHAAGQVVGGEINPGSTSAQTILELENGDELRVSFNVGAAFTMDVSRLTAMESPPVADGPKLWSSDGWARGTMSRTFSVFEEAAQFSRVENPDGTITLKPERRVEERHERIHFERVSTVDNESVWKWKTSPDDASGELVFNGRSDLVSSTSSGGTIDFDLSEIRTMAAAAAVNALSQDGYEDGFLEDVAIDQNGRIFGHYSNEVVELLAQLAMATVPNTNGLHSSSGTLFYTSASSGDIMIGVAGDAAGSSGNLPPIGAGTLVPQHIEGSNTELAIEFTNLIQIERGYQANARVITTADEMLQQLVAMKR